MTKYLLKFENKLYWYDNSEVFAIYLIEGVTEETLTREVIEQYGVAEFPKKTLISALNFVEILVLEGSETTLDLRGTISRFERPIMQTDWVVLSEGYNIASSIKHNIKAVESESNNVKINITYDGKDYYFWDSYAKKFIKTANPLDMSPLTDWLNLSSYYWNTLIPPGFSLERYKFNFMFISNEIKESFFKDLKIAYSYKEV